MATPVKRIEKEYLLKILFDEKLPIIYVCDRTEYTLTLKQPVGEEMTLLLERPIQKIKPRSRIDLLFNYRGQLIEFSSEVLAVKDDIIVCITPETIYKDLDRNYKRIDIPSDIKILFTFGGDRYNLSFPKISEFEELEEGELLNTIESPNLSGLIKHITSWVNNHADGYKIVNFKDKKPETIEEKIVSETGKALYIPSTLGYFPQTDPYPKKRIITEEIFKRYLENTGINITKIGETCTRFIKKKFEAGFYSDAWIPVLFHEYVIGYIHIWINKDGKPPFDFSVLDNLFQFSKMLAFSLKEAGYFEQGKMQNNDFDGRVLDISASGLLFAYPHSTLSSTLIVGTELMVRIETPKRSIDVTAKIVRRFRDKTGGYFGCRFTDLVPEDSRFLFEYLYGKPFDEGVSTFLTGQV